MNTFTVSFFGHRILDDPFPIEQKLEALLCQLLREQEYVEFLVGRDGEFDQLVSSVIRRCRKRLGDENSAHVLVLPYETAEYRGNREAFHAYYDEIEIFSRPGELHYKAVFGQRNRSMTDRSDLVVFCVQHSSGGAYQTMRYALRQEKSICNLAL